MSENILLQAALGYERIGWYVLPLDETVSAKKPRIEWKDRRDQRPTADEIRAWWTMWPNSNVGIGTGAYSDVDVLDFDGADVLAKVEQFTGVTIDQVYSVTSGRVDGGTHVYYKHDPDSGLKNWVKALPGISLDVRTTNGILVVPPSVHFKTGAVYRWNGLDPRLNGAEFKSLPKPLVDAIVLASKKIVSNVNATSIMIDGVQVEIPTWTPRNATESDLGYAGSIYSDLPDSIPAGERDDTILRICCSWRGCNVPRVEAEDRLKELFSRVEQPKDKPFTWAEAVTKLDQAWGYPAGNNAAPIDPVAAASTLEDIKLWIKITPNPQYEWIKKVEGLPEGDIDIIIDAISAKTKIQKTTLKKEFKKSQQHKINKDNAAAADTAFSPLNTRYGYTTVGKTSYIVDTTRKDKLKVITPKTFEEMYGNQFVKTTNAGGDIIRKPLGTEWMRYEYRRDFEKIYFHPAKTIEGCYNMYNGFAVTPADTVDMRYIQLYVNHVNNIICSNVPETVSYMWAWMADIFQHPEEKKGVAVALRGGRGFGKGFCVQPLGSLWGVHYLPLTNPNQVTGRFNSHLGNKILVFLDEAFWSGDSETSKSVLKGLITERKTAVEGKNVDIIVVDNFCKFIMASNEEWTVPSGADERRFCCIDVSDAKAKDHVYFAALAKEIANPLFAPNLLRYLLDYKYDCVAVRKAPASAALTGQKLYSLDNTEEFWFEELQLGQDGVYKTWEKESIGVTTSQLYSDYIKWCQEKRRSPIAARNAFCKKIFGVKGLCPDAKYKKRVTNNEVGYIVPALAECRKSFEKYMDSDNLITW